MFSAAKRFLSREPAHDTPPLQITKIFDAVRTWLVIVDAKTRVAITARDFNKMFLIDPKIHVGESDTYGGKIEISFPADSGCEPLNIPLRPTQDWLENWRMVNNVIVWESNSDGYVVVSLDPDAVYGPDTPSKTLSRFLGRTVLLVLKAPKLRWVLPTTNFPNLRASAMFRDGYPILVANDSSFEDIAKQVRMAANAEGDGEDTFKIHGFNNEV
ncbi:hypothetical protein M407DRAFT_23498 [Tulasnella calospora MUT 4182]|uniref:Uncharacterized protein n=1 Tax=Tulasnella calospora MUT 4182 TaxID=1051891 RepID=A0A0C3QL90_9AGAM|nr:hypothetical protein M407DRAFT_23498 [Tulasnella calospora MUT 4182]